VKHADRIVAALALLRAYGSSEPGTGIAVNRCDTEPVGLVHLPYRSVPGRRVGPQSSATRRANLQWWEWAVAAGGERACRRHGWPRHRQRLDSGAVRPLLDDGCSCL